MFTVLYILWFAVSWTIVIANTEIRNFEAVERQEVIIPQTSKWPILYSGANGDEWSLELSSVETPLGTESRSPAMWDPKSCPREMWVILDLDREEWKDYSKFTLRLSWPAYTPASFFVQIHTAESLSNQLSEFQHTEGNTYQPRNKTSRRMYAHIRAVDETDSMFTSESSRRVVFHIVLEPLIMGVLPASVQPTIVIIVLAASMTALVVPWINQYLERLAKQARAEVTGAKIE